MKLYLLLVSLFVTVVLCDNSALISELNAYLQASLPAFKTEMKNGLPQFNVPPLDPLILGSQDFETKNAQVDIWLHLQQLNIIGLSNCDVKLGTDSNQITVEIVLRSLEIRGNYKLDGKLLKIIPVFGNGGYNVDVRGAKLLVKGNFRKQPGQKITWEVSSMRFDYSELELHLENFLGGGSLGDVVQRIVPAFGKQILALVHPKIEEVMKPTINQLVNNVIKTDEVQPIVEAIMQS